MEATAGLGYDDALAERQTVGLDDDGDIAGLDVLVSVLGPAEDLVERGRYAVLVHEVLGEDLAAFDDGGVRPGTEAGHPGGLESVHAARHERVVGSHDSVISRVRLGELDYLVYLHRAYGHALGVGLHSGVAGKSPYMLHGRVFVKLLDDGVLPAASAYYKYFHIHLS